VSTLGGQLGNCAAGERPPPWCLQAIGWLQVGNSVAPDDTHVRLVARYAPPPPTLTRPRRVEGVFSLPCTTYPPSGWAATSRLPGHGKPKGKTRSQPDRYAAPREEGRRGGEGRDTSGDATTAICKACDIAISSLLESAPGLLDTAGSHGRATPRRTPPRCDGALLAPSATSACDVPIARQRVLCSSRNTKQKLVRRHDLDGAHAVNEAKKHQKKPKKKTDTTLASTGWSFPRPESSTHLLAPQTCPGAAPDRTPNFEPGRVPEQAHRTQRCGADRVTDGLASPNKAGIVRRVLPKVSSIYPFVVSLFRAPSQKPRPTSRRRTKTQHGSQDSSQRQRPTAATAGPSVWPVLGRRCGWNLQYRLPAQLQGRPRHRAHPLLGSVPPHSAQQNKIKRQK